MEQTNNKNSTLTALGIPIAIVFGFGLLAVAIYFAAPTMPQGLNNPTNDQGATAVTTKKNIRPVDDSDHIRGNPNAPILIVEYSDYDCPFCKNFHETMTKIMNEYGVDGKVAWVYRQLPIPQLHPNAPRISEAALCVGDVAGTDGFWKFSDLIFSERGVNEPTNVSRLPEFAKQAGADEKEFMACLDSGRMKNTVAASQADADGARISGTPNSIIIIGDQQVPIEGAQPYGTIKQTIDNLIGQLEGTIAN